MTTDKMPDMGYAAGTDEPVFILKAGDGLSVQILTAYVEVSEIVARMNFMGGRISAEAYNAEMTRITSIKDLTNRVHQWRTRNNLPDNRNGVFR